MFKKENLSSYSSILFISLLLVVSSCSHGNKGNSSGLAIDSADLEQDIFEDISTAKQIFYSLPSPLESAMLIKSSGATFDEKLLNPVTNTSKYTSNKSIALNLGIYSTDLSYASLFDQAQMTITYMNASKKMADGLGILDAIDKSTIDRLEENINNRDVILDIISETFMSATSFLKDNDRQALSSIVMVGGWIEGLYIGTQLVGDKPIADNKVVDKIVDQKLSIDMVLKLLESNKANQDVAGIITEMNDLKSIYDKITIKSSKIEPVVDSVKKVTTLKSKSTSNVTQEVFVELRDKIKNIRTNYTL
jgi:hypothetical protein